MCDPVGSLLHKLAYDGNMSIRAIGKRLSGRRKLGRERIGFHLITFTADLRMDSQHQPTFVPRHSKSLKQSVNVFYRRRLSQSATAQHCLHMRYPEPRVCVCVRHCCCVWL